MTFKLYKVGCDGCDDLNIPEFGNAFHITMIKDALRKVELECEDLVAKNQETFGDSWEQIDKAHDLMQQLFDEIKLEDI